MRKFISVLICFTFLFLTGCKNTDTAPQSHTEVTVNMPSDNTVNGYRISYSSEMPSTVSGENTAVGKLENEKEAVFCANKNSKVFHKKDCNSVKDIKQENRVYYSDREKLINEGFSPCKRCNP